MSYSPATGLARILGRPQDKAVFDRYSLVRKFFIRQASNPYNTRAGTNLPRFPTVTLASGSTGRHCGLGVSWTWSTTRVSVVPSTIRAPLRCSSVHFRFVHTTIRTQQHEQSPRSDQPPPKPNNSKIIEDATSRAESPTEPDPRQFENYSKFFRQLAMSLPHLHRPTRDDFLNAATGFWQRMRIRFKWLTIRSFRRYNADDISAFITWFFMSQTIWLLVGT